MEDELQNENLDKRLKEIAETENLHFLKTLFKYKDSSNNNNNQSNKESNDLINHPPQEDLKASIPNFSCSFKKLNNENQPIDIRPDEESKIYIKEIIDICENKNKNSPDQDKNNNTPSKIQTFNSEKENQKEKGEVLNMYEYSPNRGIIGENNISEIHPVVKEEPNDDDKGKAIFSDVIMALPAKIDNETIKKNKPKKKPTANKKKIFNNKKCIQEIDNLICETKKIEEELMVRPFSSGGKHIESATTDISTEFDNMPISSVKKSNIKHGKETPTLKKTLFAKKKIQSPERNNKSNTLCQNKYSKLSMCNLHPKKNPNGEILRINMNTPTLFKKKNPSLTLNENNKKEIPKAENDKKYNPTKANINLFDDSEEDDIQIENNKTENNQQDKVKDIPISTPIKISPRVKNKSNEIGDKNKSKTANNKEDYRNTLNYFRKTPNKTIQINKKDDSRNQNINKFSNTNKGKNSEFNTLAVSAAIPKKGKNKNVMVLNKNKSSKKNNNLEQDLFDLDDYFGKILSKNK